MFVYGAGGGGATLVSLGLATRSYGTGVDGDLTVAGTRTETQHRSYLDLVVPAAQILQPEGFVISARRKITIAGTVRRNGNAAVTGAAATPINTNSIWSVAHGAGAGNTGAGSPSGGSTNQPAYGGTGGNGGSGTGGAGGTSPTFSTLARLLGLLDADPWLSLTGAISDYSTNGIALQTGQGGSGGGGNGAQTGGGGGGTAGGIILIAPIIEIQAGGIIQALGGAGAPGQASNCGGGGGGGGGNIALLCELLIESGTLDVSGGAGGASGGGSGVAGSAGGAGRIFRTGVA